MSKFISKLEEFNLDKQIEKRTIKWIISNTKEESRLYAKNFLKDKNNLKEAVKEYLDTHPRVHQEYKNKKRNQLRLKLALAAGTLTVGTIAGTLTLKENKEPIIENTQIEQTQEYYEEVNEIEENENQYAEFFETIENEDNTQRRDDIILEQTKQIIVDAYNMQNPDNQITINRLQVLILNERVIQRTDRLGNVTYQRIDRGNGIELADNEELVEKGQVYVFSIDGNNVATYLENGDRLEDSTIENEEPFFATTLDMLEEYQNLVDNFRYSTNEYYTNIAEENFKIQADILLGENNINNQIEQEISERD